MEGQTRVKTLLRTQAVNILIFTEASAVSRLATMDSGFSRQCQSDIFGIRYHFNTLHCKLCQLIRYFNSGPEKI